MAAEEAVSPIDNSIREQARAIVSRTVRVDISELSDGVHIRDELPIDSLMAMQIVAACERQFGIRMDEARVAELPTVGDFLDLVVKLCAA